MRTTWGLAVGLRALQISAPRQAVQLQAGLEATRIRPLNCVYLQRLFVLSQRLQVKGPFPHLQAKATSLSITSIS